MEVRAAHQGCTGQLQSGTSYDLKGLASESRSSDTILDARISSRVISSGVEVVGCLAGMLFMSISWSRVFRPRLSSFIGVVDCIADEVIGMSGAVEIELSNSDFTADSAPVVLPSAGDSPEWM